MENHGVDINQSEIPDIKGYKTAIKRQTESEFLADLKKIRQEYAQSVKHIQSASDFNILQTSIESQDYFIQDKEKMPLKIKRK